MSWHRRVTVGSRASVRIANAVRHSAIRFGGADLATLDRSYAVVAVSAGRSTVPGALQLAEVVRHLRAKDEIDSAVMLTYGGDRVLLFPFTADGSEPIGVVKVPKDRGLVDRTINVQKGLSSIGTRVTSAIAASIPAAFGIAAAGDTIAASEGYLPGMAIATSVTDPTAALDDKVESLGRALAWLVEFHSATEVRRVSLSDARVELDSAAEAYARAVAVADDAVLLEWLRATVVTLGSLTVSIAMQHRDFATWNVLRDGDQIAVVDWEGAREGIGALDAIHFATTWLYSMRRANGLDDEAACVRDLLSPGTDIPSLTARRELSRYFEAAGIDPRLLAPLTIAHRIELAARRIEQRSLQSETEGAEPNEVQIVHGLARHLQTSGGTGWI
jgi:hypothetical protein